MSSNVAIRAVGLSKCYQIYERPEDRLKQMVVPRVAKLFGRPGKNFFREFWALRGVDLTVERGETFGVIGRNGSGKSTLLQLVAGTLSPTEGTVETRGRIAAILELGSGFNPEFSGRENAVLNAGLYGLPPSMTKDRLPAIQAFADIGEFFDEPVKTYSSGMVVRLAFAVIAHVDAEILIIDEALAVGDAFFTQKCMRFLREFKQRGTIFFVSHDTQAIQSLCDRAALITGGQLTCIGDARMVTETYLENLYANQQVVALPNRTTKHESESDEPAIDYRQAVLEESDLRNDIRVFEFDLTSSGFGAGGAHIREVSLRDQTGERVNQVHGGEVVSIEVAIDALSRLERPIVGFYVKDRLGQNLFGDSTFLSFRARPQAVPQGGRLRAWFKFRMPTLPPGDYFVSLAVADGTQEDHVQHHWVHEALMFKSVTSSVSKGLIGIPMMDIQLRSDTTLIASSGSAFDQNIHYFNRTNET